MNKVAIVTDSAVAIPEELIQKYDIQVVPLLSVLGDKSYRDRIDLKTPGELFQLIQKSKERPTTSSPPPVVYLEVYRQLSQKADSILCITISSVLSMSFNAATQAKEMAQKEIPGVDIQIFDSRTTVQGSGFIVLAAARAAASGQDITKAIEAAKDVQSKVNCIFIFDTLSYLAKSGRIGRAAALTGNLLNIKPIVEVPPATGIVEPVTRVRTRAKAINRLLEIAEQRVGTTKPVHIMVGYTCSLEEAEKLKQRVSSQFNCVELLSCEFNPVASLITGPGVLGLGFYSEGS